MDDAASVKFIASVVEIAKDFDARLIAEGVENQADVDRMHHMGIDCLQGNFIAKPVGKSKLQKVYSSPIDEKRAAS